MQCAHSAHAVRMQCTRSAHAECTCRVRMQCTCSAHEECTCSAHAVRMQCTCSAHAVHMQSAHAVHTHLRREAHARDAALLALVARDRAVARVTGGVTALHVRVGLHHVDRSVDGVERHGYRLEEDLLGLRDDLLGRRVAAVVVAPRQPRAALRRGVVDRRARRVYGDARGARVVHYLHLQAGKRARRQAGGSVERRLELRPRLARGTGR